MLFQASSTKKKTKKNGYYLIGGEMRRTYNNVQKMQTQTSFVKKTTLVLLWQVFFLTKVENQKMFF